MTKYLPFYLDNDGYMQNDKSFMITGSSLGYLTAFLNSSLFKFVYQEYFPSLGNGRELRKFVFDTIRVINVTKQENALFEKLVTEIQDDYSELKVQQIDKKIFDIYQLTENEREAIGFIDIK